MAPALSLICALPFSTYKHSSPAVAFNIPLADTSPANVAAPVSLLIFNLSTKFPLPSLLVKNKASEPPTYFISNPAESPPPLPSLNLIVAV